MTSATRTSSDSTVSRILGRIRLKNNSFSHKSGVEVPIYVTLEPGGLDARRVRSDPALYLGSKRKLEQ